MSEVVLGPGADGYDLRGTEAAPAVVKPEPPVVPAPTAPIEDLIEPGDLEDLGDKA